jgi:crossover junction endodeoxyribonuclease RusA
MGSKRNEETKEKMIDSFYLPWPPSNNTYYRRVGNKTLISKKGRIYRDDVLMTCIKERVKNFGSDPLAIRIQAFYPDRRKRDLDNLLKAPLDAMMKAGVFDDDSQIESLSIRKVGLEKPGQLFIEIRKTDELKAQ